MTSIHGYRVNNIYLSGPISSDPSFIETFASAARHLRIEGFNVFNPAEHQEHSAPSEGPEAYRHYMAFELPQVTNSDAVVVLPNWKHSKGARLEVHTAAVCGIPVFSYPEMEPVEAAFLAAVRMPGDDEPATDDDGAVIQNTNQYVIQPTNQYIVTNEVTGGQKETRPARFDLLPWDQLWKVAELYAYGANKYEDRNWERGYAFSLSIAALYRHMAKFVQGENDDPESGCPHMSSVVFHALALMRFCEQTKLNVLPLELDDRPVLARVRAREDAA